MDEAAVVQYIAETFGGVDTMEAAGDWYFIYDPERKLPDNLKMPFATLVTGDRHDQASNLDRPDVYRLNLGVKKDTYRALFGAQPRGPLGDVVETGFDYTALDQFMPHPIYASMSWVCVLNPSEETFQTARELLDEAYARAESTYSKRINRG